MMPTWHQSLFTFLLSAIGALIWFVRLEARVGTLEKAMEKHLAAFSKMDERLEEHFLRVEQKIDTLNLRCAAFHHSWNYPPRTEVIEPRDPPKGGQ